MSYTAPFLFAKIAGIGYVTILYFIVGIGMAKVFDTLYGTFDSTKCESNEKNLWVLGIDIIIHMFLISVLIYILRNIIERIPFPLEGMGGYEHVQLKELDSAPILSVVTIMFQNNFSDKVNYFTKNIIRKPVDT